MQDKHPWISFTPAQLGESEAQPLDKLAGTNAICPVCHKPFPVSTEDVAAYKQTHRSVQSTAVFKATVDHGTHP